ncbi:MAG: TRAP transporter substrate-binding protein [Pararhodobacter sp.]|nr:TRAP transporter substrate-binding protein [Pararhodobacter sp.]
MLKRTLAGLAVGIALTASVTTAQARELTFAVFIPAASPTVQQIYEPWIEWFNEEAADHGVSIRMFAGGTLGRNPLAQAQMVRDGVADITLTVPSYTPGVYPDYDIFELPGFASSAAEGSLAALEMQREGLLRGYEDFHVVAMYSSGAYMLHSRNPIASIEDVDGQRFRVAGQIQTAVIEALGGVPQSLGAGEMAENIDRGLIDGAMTDASVARTFRVTDVTSHHYDANLGVLVFAIVMNRGVYEELPEPVQELLVQSGEVIVERQIEHYGAAIERNIAEWQEDPDRTVVIPDEAERARIAAAVQPVIDRVAEAASPGLIEAYVERLEDIRNR